MQAVGSIIRVGSRGCRPIGWRKRATSVCRWDYRGRWQARLRNRRPRPTGSVAQGPPARRRMSSRGSSESEDSTRSAWRLDRTVAEWVSDRRNPAASAAWIPSESIHHHCLARRQLQHIKCPQEDVRMRLRATFRNIVPRNDLLDCEINPSRLRMETPPRAAVRAGHDRTPRSRSPGRRRSLANPCHRRRIEDQHVALLAVSLPDGSQVQRLVRQALKLHRWVRIRVAPSPDDLRPQIIGYAWPCSP